MRISDWSSDVCSSDLAAQHAVHVLQAGGDAAEATLLEGGLHGFDGLPDRILERDETAFRAALVGQLEQPLFGFLDLVGGGFLDLGVIGAVEDRKCTRLNSSH